MIWLERFLCLIFPNRCIFCDAPVKGIQKACTPCLDTIVKTDFLRICKICGRYWCTCKKLSPRFKRAVAPFVYTGSAKEGIKRFKFQKRPGYAKLLTSYMISAFKKAGFPNPDLITCIPMYWQNQRKRGFNQAELLAKETAKYLNVPYRDLFVCTEKAKAQHLLSASERIENVRKSYRLKKSAISCKGKIVLIIDDVMTTGETLNTCAKLISRYNQVYCLTFAATQK